MALEKPGSISQFFAENPEATQSDYDQQLNRYRAAARSILGVEPDVFHNMSSADISTGLDEYNKTVDEERVA